MAEEACHGFGSTTQVGLTQALAVTETSMSPENISLLLSIAGLALGFISAYGRIKGFFVGLFKRSGEALSKWSRLRDERIEMLATNPNALIAYIARSVLYMVGVTLVTYTVAGSISSNLPALVWLRGLSLLVGASLIGLELGSLHPTVRDVSKRALELSKCDRDDG